MEKSFFVAIVLAVSLAVGIANATSLMTPYNSCDCNNLCSGVENNTAIPNELSCKQFFICIDGRPIPNTCPPGQSFNATTSLCDTEPNPDCDPSQEFQCPPDGIHFFPHEDYCEKFIMCFAGFPIPSRCADGLHFDRELGTCNFPEYAECMLEVCPPYTDPENITFIPSDVDCEKFYICYGGQPIQLRCAPGIHFNPVTNQCDFPENANCTIGERPEVPEGPDPVEIECECQDGIYFVPHPNSCEHYFICARGQSHLFPCAPGFWFDEVNDWCDLPDLVQCAAAPSVTTPSSEDSDDQQPTGAPIPPSVPGPPMMSKPHP